MRSRSIPTLSRRHPRVPLRRQIDPVQIAAHDQSNLLSPRPTLELRLAAKRLVNLVIRLPVKQASNVVAVGESLKLIEFVLEDAAVQVPADADVERSS